MCKLTEVKKRDTENPQPQRAISTHSPQETKAGNHNGPEHPVNRLDLRARADPVGHHRDTFSARAPLPTGPHTGHGRLGQL